MQRVAITTLEDEIERLCGPCAAREEKFCYENGDSVRFLNVIGDLNKFMFRKLGLSEIMGQFPRVSFLDNNVFIAPDPDLNSIVLDFVKTSHFWRNWIPRFIFIPVT